MSASTSELSRLFRALGDRTRLCIVNLLAHGELCVCHLETALKLPQPKTSRHLGVLRQAGVVEVRRDGAWMYYRLARHPDPQCARILRSIAADSRKTPGVKRDLDRLVKSVGPGACR